MRKINAVIIDDEYSNRGLIKKLITELNPCFNVMGEAESVASGYKLINSLNPEIVFLDIKMSDGSGFTLLEQFDKIRFGVVFISGFDSYALRAFEFNALDYVLKPIDAQKFGKTLLKVQYNIENKELHHEELRSMLQTYDSKQMIIIKIPVHVRNKVILISLTDLVLAKSVDGCTLFKTSTNQTYISSKQLSDFEFIFETNAHIVKVNKGTFINLNFVSSYSKGLNCFVYLVDGSEIEISRRKKGQLLGLLSHAKRV